MPDILTNINQKLIESGYSLSSGVYLRSDGKYATSDEYTENFGLQWNEFSTNQLDSCTGIPTSESRLSDCSGWLPFLSGKLVLELGSGAGRFTEIFLKYGAIVISVELSSAIYANYSSNHSPNLYLLKDSILDLSLEHFDFDFVFCYGVAQHLPDPASLYHVARKHLTKKSARLSIDHYWRRLGPLIPCFFYYPKYLWRPITKFMKPALLLELTRNLVSLMLPIDIFLRRKCGSYYKLVRLLLPIPLANYYGLPFICSQDRHTLYEYAVMDTFDMLGARFDEPWTIRKLNSVARSLNLLSFSVSIKTNNGNGLVLNGSI